jgi:hypothetical protein
VSDEAAAEGRFPFAGAIIGTVLLIGLTMVGGEVAVKVRGESARLPAYLGGVGAWLAILSGMPFLLKIVRMKDTQSAAFWMYWGLGLLTRTGAGLVAAVVLLQVRPEDGAAGVLVLGSVYFVALMVETVWLAKRVARSPGEMGR